MSVVSITASLVTMGGAALIGPLLCTYLGPVASIWIGNVPFLGALMLIGNPSIFFPDLALDRDTIFITYSFIGFGAGIIIVSTIAGFSVCLKDVGIDQQDVSAVLGAYTAICPMFALGFGPVITEAILDGAGVAISAAVLFGISGFVMLMSIIFHHKLLGLKEPKAEPKEGAPSADSPADAATVEN